MGQSNTSYFASEEALHFGRILLDTLRIEDIPVFFDPATTDNKKILTVSKKYYGLSLNLQLLLKIYEATNIGAFVNKAKEISFAYLKMIDDGEIPETHLGLGSVFLELYKLTGNDAHIEHTLKVIRFEESITLTDFHNGRIITYNLFTLLKSHHLSNCQETLLKINLSIFNLLKYCWFEKGGIYFPYLYKMEAYEREIEERTLKLLFLQLHRFSGNQVFLDFANSATFSGSHENYFSKKTSEQASLKKDRLIHSPELECILIDSLISINERSTSLKIDTSKIIKAVTGDLRLEGNYNHLYKNLILYIDIYISRICPDREIATGINFIEGFPAISGTKEEMAQFILFNQFPKCLTILRDRIPGKLEKHLIFCCRQTNADMTTMFSNFIIGAMETNKYLGKFLKPLFKLELSGYKQLYKNRHRIYKSLNVTEPDINTAFDSESGAGFKTCGLSEIVHIEINQTISAYIFTFSQVLISNCDCYIVNRYRPSAYLNEEIIIGYIDAVLLKIFKQRRSGSDGLEHFLKYIEHDHTELNDVKTLFINRIKMLLQIKLLKI